MQRLSRVRRLGQGGGGAPPYAEKVKALFGTSILAYLPLWDAAGSTTAEDISGNSRNGSYSNVTLGDAGIGDGKTAALFVPASTSVIDWYTVSLRDAFNGDAGSLFLWMKPLSPDVWAGVTNRNLFNIAANTTTTFVRIRKTTTVNQLWLQRVAGGVTSTASVLIAAPAYNVSGWLRLALTWDVAGNAFRGFINGAQVDTDKAANGAWGATKPAAINTVIGNHSTSGTNVWDGYIAHVVLLNRAATIAEVASDYANFH
jgi:hypothetical protein